VQRNRRAALAGPVHKLLTKGSNELQGDINIPGTWLSAVKLSG
jgi:hypothetical protein